MKTINRSIPRKLKAGFPGYLALCLVMMSGIYFVVSSVAASISIENGLSERNDTNRIEDGEFVMFAPLSSEETEKAESTGAQLEEGFYLDYSLADGSTLRAFQNRSRLNLLDYDDGAEADSENEIALEKQYAQKHGLTVGDTLEVADISLHITGIVSAPDYETVTENISDTTADHEKFGLMFMTQETYQNLKDTETALRAECYQYFYRFSESQSEDADKNLKSILEESKISIAEIQDDHLLDYIAEQNEFLSDYDGDLRELFSGDVFENVLNEANEKLAQAKITLTKENYYDTLTKAAEQLAGKDDKQSEKMLTLRGKLEQCENLNMDDIRLDNLLSFMTAENSPRMGEVISDISIMKQAGLFGGIVMFVLIIYIVSIFIIHDVEQQSNMIGTLYSMGMEKRTLMFHFTVLPTLTAMLGGVIGTLIGFTPKGTGFMVNSLVSTYSLPKFRTVFPLYLIIYGFIVPPLTSVIVNVITLNKKLSKEPLSLIRNEGNHDKASRLKLKHFSFLNAFRIRQFIRERKCGAAIIVGVILSTIMLMMSQYISVGLGNMGKNIGNDVKFEHMYFLKYPSKEYTDGERSYIKSLNAVSVVDGKTTFDVSVLGVQKDSEYFDFDASADSTALTLSSSVAIKFKLSEGDTFTLHDEMNETDYTFTVANIVPYSAGLYTFMDIDTMRELFDADPDFYNAIFSADELEIDTADLYSTVNKADFLSFVDVFVTNMSPMIYAMYTMSVILFTAVLFLMIKVSVDHSEFSVSMMRIFGYNDREIRKLYLDGNFVMFVIAALLGFPIARGVMSQKWPQMVDHVAMGIDVSFSWKNYLLIIGTMFVAYFAVILLLNHNIKKKIAGSAVEFLKNRE